LELAQVIAAFFEFLTAAAGAGVISSYFHHGCRGAEFLSMVRKGNSGPLWRAKGAGSVQQCSSLEGRGLLNHLGFVLVNPDIAKWQRMAGARP
jgi:hypothetical protein